LLLHLILQGSQPQQQAADAAQIDKHQAAAQQHENQPPSQTEVSTGSASLAAASGLLAIAGGGTAGKCKPGGQVLGSSESDGTPHPEHSTPSAGPPSPHMRRQQQQAQQQSYQQYQQQPLMLLQQQQMLLHLQAAGMQAMAPGGCMVQGQPLMNATAQAATAGSMFFPAAAAAAAAQQQQPAQPQVMAYPAMGPPGHVQLGNGKSTAAEAAAGTAAYDSTVGNTLDAAAAGVAGSIQANGGAAGGGIKAEADAAAGNAGGQSGCRRSLALRGPCYHCGTTISSQWRSGPPDKPVLCNACGLYYRKVQSLPDHTCQVAGALSVSSLGACSS
jgi:hypothetical protein